MQEQQETRQEKKKRGGMTKYEKVKLRILVFIAVLLVSQAVVNIGSILHFTVSTSSMIEEYGIPLCTNPPTGLLVDLFGITH